MPSPSTLRAQSPPGDKVLKQLAESTGGQLYVVSTEKDFPLLFSATEQQLRTQYFVSFRPVDLTPGFHTVKIQLAGGGEVPSPFAPRLFLRYSLGIDRSAWDSATGKEKRSADSGASWSMPFASAVNAQDS